MDNIQCYVDSIQSVDSSEFLEIHGFWLRICSCWTSLCPPATAKKRLCDAALLIELERLWLFMSCDCQKRFHW